MSRHRHFEQRRSGKNVTLLACVGVVLLICLIAGGYALGRYFENRTYHEERQQMSENFGKLPTVTYNNILYVRRPEVDTFLLMGVDRPDGEEPSGYRRGGQADFLLLIAIDSKNKTVHQLQIDRDSITDVPIVGVLGNDAGTRRMQVGLSHAYGGSEEDRCKHTVQAVANLLGGETAQHYMSAMMNDIGVLNQVLGGITVTMPEDYTNQDPAMVKGAVLTLTDAQAEILVRSRLTVGDGTNASRMERQRSFLSAAIDQVRSKILQDADFAGSLLDAIDQMSGHTDYQRGQLINLLNQINNYDVLPVETLRGEYKTGADGFAEFYADESSAVEWVLQTLYEPKE